jgi:hypothetical protein
MNWHDAPIGDDEYGRPLFKGVLHLLNDKREKLGGIMWFEDAGPFYAHAMDVNDITLVRRIGPCSTIDSAKRAIVDAIEGRLNISNRAGYPR